MSFRQSRTSFRGGNRVAQVFKKRHGIINEVASLNNNNATLLDQITLEETCTVYAIKIGVWGQALSTAAGDGQIQHLFVRCVPADTALPDLTDNDQVETMNGFYVGSFLFNHTTSQGGDTGLNQKFRFRRKCDRNSLVQLLVNSTNVQGTGRTVEWSGAMQVIARVR